MRFNYSRTKTSEIIRRWVRCEETEVVEVLKTSIVHIWAIKPSGTGTKFQFHSTFFLLEFLEFSALWRHGMWNEYRYPLALYLPVKMSRKLITMPPFIRFLN